MLSDCDHRVRNCQFKLSFSKETRLIFLQSIGSILTSVEHYSQERKPYLKLRGVSNWYPLEANRVKDFKKRDLSMFVCIVHC